MSAEKPIMGHMELPTFVEVTGDGLVAVDPRGMRALSLALATPEYADKARAIMSSSEVASSRGAKLNALIIEVIFYLGLGALAEDDNEKV